MLFGLMHSQKDKKAFPDLGGSIEAPVLMPSLFPRISDHLLQTT